MLSKHFITVACLTVALIVPAGAARATTHSSLYRLFSSRTGDHFFTASSAERDSAVRGEYTSEGSPGYVETTAASGLVPLYRLYSAARHEHFYTSDSTERDGAVKSGFSSEGIAAYLAQSNQTDTTALYRIFLKASTGLHFYTTSSDERNALVSRGEAYEGISGYLFTNDGTTVQQQPPSPPQPPPPTQTPPPPSPSPPPPPPPAPSGSWNTYQGFNFQAWNRDQYGTASAATSFTGLAATGANAVSINTIWFQDSGSATVMYQDGNYTPSDASMVTAIQRAKARGMKVMIRPMINTYGNSTWRGAFNPYNQSEWFANYRTFMNRYADMAATQGADILDIGSEYNSLQGNSSEWRHVVSDVRAHFHGLITYSGNWDQYQSVSWYDAVDLIGIDAYFPLAQSSYGYTPSEDEIVARWSNNSDAYGPNTHIISDISAVQARFNKPVIFSELGYRSGADPLRNPWETGGSYDPTDQQHALNAAFRAFDGKPWFRGMFIWEWNADPNAGGAGDTDHTPQRKPAQDTVTARYSRT